MSNRIYVVRNRNLKSLGFVDYPQYLESRLWKSIRQSVLVRDGFKCRKCDRSSAHHVHHSSYDVATLRGDDLSKLHSVCDWCHREIEFDGDEKRTGSDAVAFDQWLPSNRLPDGNVARKAKKKLYQSRKKVAKLPPGERTATRIQIERLKTLSGELGISFDSARTVGLTQSGFYSWRTELEQRIKKAEQDRLKKEFAKENRRFK